MKTDGKGDSLYHMLPFYKRKGSCIYVKKNKRIKLKVEEEGHGKKCRRIATYYHKGSSCKGSLCSDKGHSRMLVVGWPCPLSWMNRPAGEKQLLSEKQFSTMVRRTDSAAILLGLKSCRPSVKLTLPPQPSNVLICKMEIKNSAYLSLCCQV